MKKVTTTIPSQQLLSLVILFLIFLPTIAHSQQNNTLLLTEQEKKWLLEHPTIKMTGDPDWLPFESFDQNGTYTGIVAEHLKLISKKLNIKIELVPNKTWTESVEMAKKVRSTSSRKLMTLN